MKSDEARPNEKDERWGEEPSSKFRFHRSEREITVDAKWCLVSHISYRSVIIITASTDEVDDWLILSRSSWTSK
jgi:hypothetical protein